MITLTSTDDLPEQIDLFMEGIQIVVSNFKERLSMNEMADAFLATGYDMVHHVAQHNMPGASPERVAESVMEHNEFIMAKMKEDVWESQE